MRIKNLVATLAFAATLSLGAAFAPALDASAPTAGYWDTARPPETAGYWDTDRYMPPVCPSSGKCAGTKAGW